MSRSGRRRLVLSTSSVLVLTACMAGVGHAQTSPAPAPPPPTASPAPAAAATAVPPSSATVPPTARAVSSGGGGIGEVVVTAQKREQTLQKVPVAITAFTGVERDKLGITSVQDMTNFTPGFVYDTGDDRVTLRGIGRYTNQLAADSSVGVYEDGGFTTFTTKVGGDTLFIDRIEVLRGPQGTLYGRNSIGGAINIVSKMPTDEFYAEIRGSYDSYNLHVEEGAVSGPITDKLQFRLAASKTDQDGGYFNNLNGKVDEGNRKHEFYTEGQLKGEFNEHFDFWAKTFVGGWDNDGGDAGGRITGTILTGPDGKTRLATPAYAVNGGSETTDSLVPSLGAFQAPGVTDVVTVNPSGLNPGNSNIRNYYSLYPQKQEVQRYYGTTVRLNGHFDGFDIRYIGSANRYTYKEHEEWGEGFQLATGVESYVDPNGITTFPDSQLRYAEYHWFTTNEFNILSTGDSPFQWVAGVYNFNEGFKQPEEISLVGQTQLSTPLTLTGLPAPLNKNRDVVFQQGRMGADTYAGFGQVDYKIIPTLKATIGARYTYDAKFGDDDARYLAFGPQIGIPLPVAFDISPVAIPLGGVAQRGATAAVLNPVTGIYTRKLAADWHGTTGTAGLQWTPDNSTNVYAKYSRGYKSGGFNSGYGLAANPETDPESSNDYQIGVKKNFGRTFQINIDGFYDQYYNAQVPVSVANGGLLSAEFYNLPQARSDGIEIETVYSPIKPLQFILNYGFNDTAVVSHECVVDAMGDPTATRTGATPGNCPVLTGGDRGQDLKGDSLPNAPRNKVAFDAVYTFDLPMGDLSFSGSYVWRDVQYGNIFTRNFNEAPSWDQVDLRAEFKSRDGHYTLIAYGKNILNSTGYNAGAIGVFQTNGTFVKNFTITPPAIGGVELQYKF